MTSPTRASLVLSAFILGIGVGTELPPSLCVGLWIFGVISLFFAKTRPTLLVLTGLIFGYCYIRTWREIRLVEPPETLDHATAWVSEAPDIRADKTFYTTTLSPPLKGRILVKIDRFPKLHYGQWISISGPVEKPEVFSGFNYPRFLERAAVYGVSSRAKVSPINRKDHYTARTPFYAFRQTIERSIQKYIPEPESSFLGGILLGSKRAIPTTIQEALRTTGTSHIVAISGANITILLGLILTLLPLKGRWSPVWATVVIGFGVSVLTGGSASVVRGAAVAVAGRIVRAAGRRVWPLPLILLSMSLMLLVNPLFLTSDPGFQLSFAAFGGLMFFGPHVTRWCEGLHWLPPPVKSALAETTAATLGTAPLSLSSFGVLSFLGLLVNPLVLWLLPAITALGLLYVTLAWTPIAKLIALPLWLLLHIALQIIIYFGRFSFATIRLQ